MALVLANTQGELHPLEEGKHAAESGLDLKSYAEAVGRARTSVSNEVLAARVASVVTNIGHADLDARWIALREIHAAPSWLWPALAAELVAREGVSVEIPKRRLTVFTGVSGSGKSSLVFGTIAAESQRLINETYSAFIQGFMPSTARPEVDVLEGITTAIIVDQERMGANARSTVGTATDANAMLRTLFSRLGKPYVGPSSAFAFNVPSVRGVGAITVDKANAKTTPISKSTNCFEIKEAPDEDELETPLTKNKVQGGRSTSNLLQVAIL